MWMMNPLLPKIPGLAKNYYPPANHVDRAGAGQTAIGREHLILRISKQNRHSHKYFVGFGAGWRFTGDK
jgi:hypothetical protein